MDIRQITPRYSVSRQISAQDLPAIAAAGFTTVICNRPDAEVLPPQQAAAIGDAARAAGLTYHIHPITHQGMTVDVIAGQRDLVRASDGPVLAYCASGNRCTIIWALGEAGHRPVDEIIGTASAAGYNISQLLPYLSQKILPD